ncbi:PAS domain-containing sensor histidine kinase [Variovorax dokdonensis]|uniref:histidine kinase n=1 Tax=Variovorax dokdonensis TaxID=344883 RepID=A0ABT7NA32_9BURK|nr:PAS domain-containing sensor histidine kinase [Variovorax dokdonensis]MDM0044725.1 PAS domain-containing sensor histidine kinase [Variovorax dokdonensis]
MSGLDPALPGVDQLYDQAPCGLALTDTTGLFLKVNRTFCAWVGMQPEDLVGRKRLQDLFTMGGRIFHQTHWLPTLQMQGSLAEVKFDVRHKGGHTIPMLLNAIRHVGDGGAYDQVSMVVAEERNKYERELLGARKRADELALKEKNAQTALEVAQARLRQAIEVGALYLWDVDPSTNERRYEEHVARLLGFKTPQKITEAMFVAATAPPDRAIEEEALARALTPPGEVVSWTIRINGVDGVQRVVFASGHSFFSEGGVLAAFVGVLRDITEVTRQRSSAEDRALFAEQMVGIVSHDLRNPLSAILMGTKLLARSELEPGKIRVLGHVSDSAERAQRLIEELLDFTMARVGPGLSVSRESIDVHKVVASVVDELSLAFPARRIVHRKRIEGHCKADADRLAQLVGNLVANALAYGDADGEVTVESNCVDGLIQVSVHNHGDAIPEEKIMSLFEPMTRGEQGVGELRSVGLGLYIVREIARAHGGEVTVSSTADEGTTFTVSFPPDLPCG